MPKIFHTTLMAILATAAVLTIAACGGSKNNGGTTTGSNGGSTSGQSSSGGGTSNGGSAPTVNGWTASDVSKLKTKFDSEISSTKSKLPSKYQAQFQTDADNFLDCVLGVVEPAAKPSVALNNNWNPPTAVQNKLTSKCEQPFEKSVQSLIPSTS